MNEDLRNRLLTLEREIDTAIEWAAANPLISGELPFARIESVCQAIMHDAGSTLRMADTESAELRKRLWNIRRRSGRLKMLLDKAAQLCLNCISPYHEQHPSYGMHGELNDSGDANLLSVRC